MRTKTTQLTSIVTGMLAGDPFELAVTTKGSLSNGSAKSHGHILKVRDAALIQELKRHVKPGDEVRLTVSTEFGANQINSFVTAFKRVSAAARSR